MLTPTFEREYICPGEQHPISRAVHLSRLASYFPNCRDCPFRVDSGSLEVGCHQEAIKTSSSPGKVGASANRSDQTDESEGFRGVWLNEMTRARAGEIASAFAALLWEHAALPEESAGAARPTAPVVVVANDERASAPDIVTGVATALRLMGCHVIDLGVATRPCVWFTVDHLDADGGIHVTGAGGGPSITGLDLIGRRGGPLSRGFRSNHGETINLATLESRMGHAVSRHSRDAVPQREFRARNPYEAGLLKHFHALRPLKIRCAAPSRGIRQTLDALFATLPCRMEAQPAPIRRRDLSDPSDADVQRMGESVRTTGADLGIVIDEDGQRCAAIDERGSMVAFPRLAGLLARHLLSEHPGSVIVIVDRLAPALHETIERAGGRSIACGPTLQDLATSMREQRSAMGIGDHRIWFRELFPTSDAVLTLARLLDCLSRSDRPLSEALRWNDPLE